MLSALLQVQTVTNQSCITFFSLNSNRYVTAVQSPHLVPVIGGKEGLITRIILDIGRHEV